MICAYLHPHATKLLHTIDELPVVKRFTARALVLAGVGVVLSIYYTRVYALPKHEYNKVSWWCSRARFAGGCLTCHAVHVPGLYLLAGLLDVCT